MDRPRVSVIIPAHNEAENLPAVVGQLIEVLDGHISHEIVIVNDNSTDNTAAVADGLAAKHGTVTVVHRHQENGIGNAIKVGLQTADGDILIPFMGDRSDDPDTIPRMVGAIDGGADIAYGSRFIDGGAVQGYPLPKLVTNRGYNLIVRLLFGLPYRDVSNAFKAYRREVITDIGIENITSTDFDITIEIPVKAHLNGFSAVEVPTVWTSRDAGVSSLQIHRKGPQYARRLLSLYWRRICQATNRFE